MNVYEGDEEKFLDEWNEEKM